MNLVINKIIEVYNSDQYFLKTDKYRSELPFLIF
jgi:hypothetical protein